MAISNSNFFQLQRQSATYVKNGPFSMAKITRGFFFWSSRSHGGSTRGFLIKTSDVSRSVPWVHWTHHETRAFGTNRNLQVFSIPKMHPSHSNSSKIEKWQYAISTFPGGWASYPKKDLHLSQSSQPWLKTHKCLKLPTSSLITLNIVPFCGIPEPSRPYAAFQSLESWMMILDLQQRGHRNGTYS